MLPNSVCISTGSLFAGSAFQTLLCHTVLTAIPNRWMMRKTGKYKDLNMIFGAFPLVAAVLLRQMREDSNQAHLWLSIVGSRGLSVFTGLQTSFLLRLDTLGPRECRCASNHVQ